MQTAQRTRASNFTVREKAILVALIRKHEDIQNTKNDKIGTTAKHKAWENLTREFNASSGENPRTQECLQRCWGNLKKNTRRAVADMKAKYIKSGRAAVRTSSLNCIEEQVWGILTITGKELSNNPNNHNDDDDDDDSVILDEDSLTINSFTKDNTEINNASSTILPIVENCSDYSVQIHGASEESGFFEGSKESADISRKFHDPLSVEQQGEKAIVTVENDENSSNWCEWIPLSLRQTSLSLQNIENRNQIRETSTSGKRRTDVTEMMKQQLREEIEFRREEAQQKRELFEIQKQQELLKLKLLQKALQNANVTISMSGTTIHTEQK